MKHVLVVIDMQNDFVGGPLGSKSAKAIVPAVVDAINDPLYDAIVVTQDTHDDTYLETLEGKKLPVPHCISTVEEFSKNFDSETSGWFVEKHVQQALMAAHLPNGQWKPVSYVNKDTFGCKALSNVSKIIPDEGYNNPNEIEFTICGLCTDVCVVANALLLRAYYPNSVIRLLAQATAGTSDEAYQAALTVMASNQIDIIR